VEQTEDRTCGGRELAFQLSQYSNVYPFRSTHNQRIERLWRDVGQQFGQPWRAFFLRLENLHHLNRSNKHHLWLIRHLFLDTINYDLTQFQNRWNMHGVSGSKTQSQTPQVCTAFFIYTCGSCLLMLRLTGGYAAPWSTRKWDPGRYFC
jgi:hypothetical protein